MMIRRTPEAAGPNDNLMSVASLPVNFSKNRYRDILPYDSTRVHLVSSNPVGGDFINANFVPVCFVRSFLFVPHAMLCRDTTRRSSIL
jgi:protein tyrosine phosphatase